MSLRLGTKIVAGNAVVVPENIYLKTTYDGGTSGYRIWSDGYCEQWGRTTTSQDISLLKTYKDTNFNVLLGTSKTANGANDIVTIVSSSKIHIEICASGSTPVHWKTFGYLASGQY